MAIAFVMDFRNSNLGQYDKVMEVLNLGGKMPPGGLFHIAGAQEKGIRVIDVWESAEQMEAFVASRLGPALGQVGVEQPTVTPLPGHNFMKA